ncbi:uncharacterized protein BDW47DRAFT_114283 [Aspergillus candidus]|uniref:Uncharacterized protein n=1 Tax=Aspergillus candidus TaxID=41067 RepID=A0A2I2EY29_ASPCN|nr:hypothetical protein BDW47DRAFT_114283 [Aspergillus candidus]PLB33283.1 hypothetical protein BDW47DRAFT_114283 [Aspergillus candidus]
MSLTGHSSAAPPSERRYQPTHRMAFASLGVSFPPDFGATSGRSHPRHTIHNLFASSIMHITRQSLALLGQVQTLHNTFHLAHSPAHTTPCQVYYRRIRQKKGSQHSCLGEISRKGHLQKKTLSPIAACLAGMSQDRLVCSRLWRPLRPDSTCVPKQWYTEQRKGEIGGSSVLFQ